MHGEVGEERRGEERRGVASRGEARCVCPTCSTLPVLVSYCTMCLLEQPARNTCCCEGSGLTCRGETEHGEHSEQVYSYAVARGCGHSRHACRCEGARVQG